MAECFCGCGRKVGFTSRGPNKQGRRTVGVLAKLREAQADVRQKSDVADDPASLLRSVLIEQCVARMDNADDIAELEEMDDETLIEVHRTLTRMGDATGEALVDLIAHGEAFEAFWASLVHGDDQGDPRLLLEYPTARSVKQAWTQWGKLCMGACRAYGIPISRIGAFTGRV